MAATRKHGRCRTCGAPMPEHLSHSARYCSRACAYRHQANKDGRTALVDPEIRFWKSVRRGGDDECWEWQSTLTHGYGVISVGGRGAGYTFAHRYSFELANGPIPEGGHILHACDNPPCVNPKHLRAGSHVENMSDMARRERGSKTKLTAADVAAIRKANEAGESQRSIASRYGISQGNVSFIMRGKTWRHMA